MLTSQIAPLFDLCDDEHDPEDPDADHDHDGKPQLGEVARLDTCVTVVDSAEFYFSVNLDSQFYRVGFYNDRRLNLFSSRTVIQMCSVTTTQG